MEMLVMKKPFYIKVDDGRIVRFSTFDAAEAYTWKKCAGGGSMGVCGPGAVGDDVLARCGVDALERRYSDFGYVDVTLALSINSKKGVK
jgi:hypothetical protein